MISCKPYLSSTYTQLGSRVKLNVTSSFSLKAIVATGFKKDPNASHMCDRIKFTHKNRRQVNVSKTMLKK